MTCYLRFRLGKWTLGGQKPTRSATEQGVKLERFPQDHFKTFQVISKMNRVSFGGPAEIRNQFNE